MRNILAAFLLVDACAVAQAQEMTSTTHKAALRREIDLFKQGVV
jgi:hypothetical protein